MIIKPQPLNRNMNELRDQNLCPQDSSPSMHTVLHIYKKTQVATYLCKKIHFLGIQICKSNYSSLEYHSKLQ